MLCEREREHERRESAGVLPTNTAPSSTLTDISSDIAIQSREDNIAPLKLIRDTLPHDNVPHPLRDGHRLLPAHRIPVLLSGRARGGAKGMDFEVGVGREEDDEPGE